MFVGKPWSSFTRKLRCIHSSLPPSFSLLPSPPLSLLRDARNMARDVQNTLLDIVKTHGKMSDEEASEYVKKLQKKGRYLQDVWS